MVVSNPKYRPQSQSGPATLQRWPSPSLHFFDFNASLSLLCVCANWTTVVKLVNSKSLPHGITWFAKQKSSTSGEFFFLIFI